MKIAFASTDGIHINEHFGWCKNFYLYELQNGKFEFVEILDSSKELQDEIDKLTYKIESIQNANIVCVAQIGPKASTMVKSANIYPLKSINENETIEKFLDILSNLINTNPPLWLKAVIAKAV
ncbi:MAG: NifB/NifX family molybdenum-iron cluster-binding protein [Arcobacteraceae bacterium]|nr:NifB/NifX family molybdenum-iron cluster-binding protein [Arcobacteraceae bacterium]